jgi:hypothetical protein
MEALARDLLEKQRAEELARTNETGEKDPVEKDPVEKDPVDTPPLDGPIGDRPVDPVDDRTRPSLLPGAIAFGAAAVLAGVGVGFGVRSNSTLGEIDDELDSGTPPLDSGDPRFDDGKRDALIADVSFALAGAAAVTGAILTLRALMSDSRPSSVSVNPTVGVGQAGVGVQVIW